VVLLLGAVVPAAFADDSVDDALEPVRSTRTLVIPLFDAERGRALFVEKGCVLCHAINGVGGGVAPALDATELTQEIRPLEFAVRMWRGATAMIALQREELGYRIDLEPDELAAIIGFAYDCDAQRALSLDDLPPGMGKLFIDEPFDGWTGIDPPRPSQVADRQAD
jgi:hypothetical protein